MTFSFTVHFTKLLTNGFQSSFEISEVCYRLGNIIRIHSCQSNCESPLNQSCEFLCQTKLGSCKVHCEQSLHHSVVCTWFCNIIINEFKQIEKYSQPSQAYFMMFTSEII